MTSASPFSVLLVHEAGLFVRNRWSLVAILGFTFLLSVVASFALRYPGITAEQVQSVFAGSLWIILLFSGTTLLAHSWQVEREDAAHWGIWLATGAGSQLFFAKFFVGTGAFVVLGALAAGALAAFLSFSIEAIFSSLLLLLLLSGAGFVAIGTLLSAVSASLREREIVLPLIFYPLMLLLLSHSVDLTTDLLNGENLSFLRLPVVFLCAFDVVSIAVAYLLFPYVVTE